MKQNKNQKPPEGGSWQDNKTRGKKNEEFKFLFLKIWVYPLSNDN